MPHFPDKKIPGHIRNAIRMLLSTAKGDTEWSQCSAEFLLSLWDGNGYKADMQSIPPTLRAYGRWLHDGNGYKADLQSLLFTDVCIFESMMGVMRYLYDADKQLDDLVTEEDIKPIIAIWGATKGE